MLKMFLTLPAMFLDELTGSVAAAVMAPAWRLDEIKEGILQRARMGRFFE